MARSRLDRGAVGNDGDLANNLTDPCWLLDRAATILYRDLRPVHAILTPLARTIADALGTLQAQADHCGEPLDVELTARMILHLRLWAGGVEAEAERLRLEGAKAPG